MSGDVPDERRLFALALAYHMTRQNNEAPEFDMGVAKERAERMLLALASKRIDGAMEPHGYVVIEAEAAAHEWKRGWRAGIEGGRQQTLEQAAAPLESALRRWLTAHDALEGIHTEEEYQATADAYDAAVEAARAALKAVGE